MDPTKEAQKEAEADKAEKTEETPKDETKADYKGELERLTKQHEKTVKALNKERSLRKEAKAASASSSEEQGSSSEEEDDDDGNESKIEAVASKVLEKLTRKQVSEEMDELVSSMSDDADERELIKAIYEKRITPSGTSRAALSRDLLDAQLLANRSRFIAEAEKKAKKSVAEAAAMRMAGTKVQAKVTEEEKPEYTKAEREFLKKYGVES